MGNGTDKTKGILTALNRKLQAWFCMHLHLFLTGVLQKNKKELVTWAMIPTLVLSNLTIPPGKSGNEIPNASTTTTAIA